jgi:hypothetical protein
VRALFAVALLLLALIILSLLLWAGLTWAGTTRCTTGSALHVMLAKRFGVTVDQQRLPMVGRSTENPGHQGDVPKVWIAEV